MCKTKPIDFSLLKSSYVAKLMKDFPICGVKYKTYGDHGLVLVHPAITSQKLVQDKIAAAKIRAKKSVCVARIPESIIDVFGVVLIPTLFDVA